jgi:hypothetical protein
LITHWKRLSTTQYSSSSSAFYWSAAADFGSGRFLRQRISAIEVLGQLLLNMTNLIPALVLLLYQSTEAGVENGEEAYLFS